MTEGWFSDPTGRHEARYHDGQGWTDHVSDAGQSDTDPLPPEEQRPFGCRDSCPTCGGRDLQVVQVGTWEASMVYRPTRLMGFDAQAGIREARADALLCFSCGSLHHFLSPAALAAARNAFASLG